MTVAYLVNQYPASSQTFIRREIRALEAQGVVVERYAVRRWTTALVDPDDQQEQQRTRYILDAGALGVAFATIKAAFTRPGPFLRALRTAWRHGRCSERGVLMHLIYLAEACVLRDWLASSGASHVHAHFGTNSTTVAMLCHLLDGPTYSFTAHGPEEFDAPGELSLGEKVAHARFAIAISEFGRSQLYRWTPPAHWDRVHVVHCVVDDGFLSAPSTPPPSDPRLVCVARFGEQKGHLNLLRAAAQLAREGLSFQINLIGDGPMRPAIESFIRDHNLQNHVRLLGWRSNAEVRQAILDSRAMVLPSFAEGLPVVIMEALALERPVITTYIAGIPELVRDRENGWLVPAGSVEPLVRAMREALTMPIEDLHRMGRAGADAVRRQHTGATEAAKLVALIQS